MPTKRGAAGWRDWNYWRKMQLAQEGTQQSHTFPPLGEECSSLLRRAGGYNQEKVLSDLWGKGQGEGLRGDKTRGCPPWEAAGMPTWGLKLE